MPKVSEEHLAGRRRQIVLAACRCFGKKGFSGTTMRDICKEAGLSAGAVYNYFKGKGEIVEALARMGRENTRDYFDSIPKPDDAPGALSSLLGSVARQIDTPQMAQSARLDVRLWGEAVHTPRIRKLFVQAHENAIEPIVEIVRQGQRRGEIDRRVAPAAVARSLIATILGLQVHKAIDPRASIAECAPVLEALFSGTFLAASKTEKKKRIQKKKRRARP